MMRVNKRRGRLVFNLFQVCLLSFGISLFFNTASAEETSADGGKSASQPDGDVRADYHSKHFLIHTDLSKEEAEKLLTRLEATLKSVAKYWGRRSRGVIECYVMKDLKNWPDSCLPHPVVRIVVGGVGGGTYESVERVGKRLVRKATIFCTARPGVAEHEAVHAYCSQNFCSNGPEWYKEGMAELAYHQRSGRPGVRCGKRVISFLRAGDPKSVLEIVERGGFTSNFSNSITAIMSGRGPDSNRNKAVQLEDWIKKNGSAVKSSRQAYRWCWALCHLLSQNPNYAARFRTMGRGFLNNRPESFRQLFSSIQKELGFEYRFFLKRIDVGYRVDLCSWNWKKSFRSLEDDQFASIRIQAARGYQASGVRLAKGQAYGYSTQGSWSTAENRPVTDSNGDGGGRGRLIGVLMKDYELSQPFELGSRGSFIAPGDGKLYLRCWDAWNQLQDNSGSIVVRLERTDVAASPPAVAKTTTRRMLTRTKDGSGRPVDPRILYWVSKMVELADWIDARGEQSGSFSTSKATPRQ